MEIEIVWMSESAAGTSGFGIGRHSGAPLRCSGLRGLNLLSCKGSLFDPDTVLHGRRCKALVRDLVIV